MCTKFIFSWCLPFQFCPVRKRLNVRDPNYDPASEQRSLDSLEQVNAYCLLHIMSYLGLMDTINLGQTCTSIKSIAELSYSRFSFLPFGESSNESELQLILEEIGHQLQSLEITRLNKTILDGLLKYCHNVRQLKLVDPSNIFNSISFTAYKPFFKNITSLEILKGPFFYGTLSRIKRFQNFDKLLLALRDVDTLESLKIDYIEVSPKTFDRLKSLKNLKCLHLNRYHETARLLPFIPNFPHLTEILLSTENSRTNEIEMELIVKDKNGIGFGGF